MRIMFKDKVDDNLHIIDASELSADNTAPRSDHVTLRIDPMGSLDFYYESEPISKYAYRNMCDRLLTDDYLDLSQYTFDLIWNDDEEENDIDTENEE